MFGWRGEKLFYLVGEKNERIENIIYINWLLCPCYIIVRIRRVREVGECNKIWFFLIEGVERWKSGNFFCLVGEKKRRIENVVYINWLLCSYYIRASTADVVKKMPFYNIKHLLYYFTTSFYNISFIRCFILQFYTLK